MNNPNFKKTIDLVVHFVMGNLSNGAAQSLPRQDTVASLAKKLLHPEERTRKGNILRLLLNGSQQETLSEIWLRQMFQKKLC